MLERYRSSCTRDFNGQLAFWETLQLGKENMMINMM